MQAGIIYKKANVYSGDLMKNGAGFVLILLIVILFIWGLRALRNWWMSAPRSTGQVEIDEEIPVTEAVALLERSGFEVMTLKRRIPLFITVDGGTEEGGEDLQSRLLVDHFAQKEDKLYIVKIEKSRKPYVWTGCGLRDQLLVYALLYEEAVGIVIVNPETKRIRTVQFEIGE
ncbi:MAG: hypothetical protein H7X86_10710 [Gorillibacterium sp.]|nr:hypothetical protein [Gorillibacterium sp.]